MIGKQVNYPDEYVCLEAAAHYRRQPPLDTATIWAGAWLGVSSNRCSLGASGRDEAMWREHRSADLLLCSDGGILGNGLGVIDAEIQRGES
jgi:hypothetical protein